MYINQVFKLTMVLNTDRFDRIFKKRDLLEADKDEYIDTSLAHKGVTVLYRDSRYKKKVSLIVDSAVVLKEKGLDAHKLINKLEKRICEYFGGKYSLKDFTLTELALTADINVGSQDMVASYIRVIRRVGKVKGFSQVRYEGLDASKNFCLEGNSNGVSFLLYDLHTTLANRSGIRDAKGILRAEVCLTSSKAIRNHSNRDNIAGQILELSGRSEKIFMGIFSQIIPSGDSYKKGEAVNIVRQKVRDLRLQRKMLRLIELISEKKSVLLAQKAMSYREPNRLLAAFTDIGLSPVTISKRMDVIYLPSLYFYMNYSRAAKEMESLPEKVSPLKLY